MTPEQEKVHFDTFGFIIKRSLFSPKEMEMFSRWFDEGCDAKCGPLRAPDRWGIPVSVYTRGSVIITSTIPVLWIRWIT